MKKSELPRILEDKPTVCYALRGEVNAKDAIIPATLFYAYFKKSQNKCNICLKTLQFRFAFQRLFLPISYRLLRQFHLAVQSKASAYFPVSGTNWGFS